MSHAFFVCITHCDNNTGVAGGSIYDCSYWACIDYTFEEHGMGYIEYDKCTGEILWVGPGDPPDDGGSYFTPDSWEEWKKGDGVEYGIPCYV